MTADEEEVIEASSATEPLRWPDPSRPIVNQRPGGGGLGGGRPGGAGGPGGGFGGATGAPGGGMGGYPFRKEDEEHRAPAHHVEPDPDDVFGTDEMTAPPVIGEDPGSDGDYQA